MSTTRVLRGCACLIAAACFLNAPHLGAAEVPFQPTQHPNVKVRHMPEPVDAAKIRAAKGKKKNDLPVVPNASPKAGKMIQADETHLVPQSVRVDSNGVCRVECGHATHVPARVAAPVR
jgi:hypothetical protein